MLNYQFIMIEYYLNNGATYQTSEYLFVTILPSDEFYESTNSTNYSTQPCLSSGRLTGSSYVSRNIYGTGNTNEIKIRAAYTMANSGTSNGYIIPHRVYGFNV